MSIMVTLIKIKKNKNIIHVSYFPEDRYDDIGTFKYDLDNSKVIYYKYCNLDEKSFLKTYFNKAILAIEKCRKNNYFPEKMEYMWY